MYEQAIELLKEDLRECDRLLVYYNTRLLEGNIHLDYYIAKYETRRTGMIEAIKALESKVKWDAYYELMRGEYE